MKVSQLRDLTRKFAAGGLTEDDYRRERAKLIDGIVNGDIQPRYREIHPDELSNKGGNGRNRQKLLTILASGILLALLVTAVLVQFLDADEPPASETATPQPEPGVELLKAFLSEDAWDDSSLEAMEKEWSGLSGFEREAARNSHHYRRLKAQTESRIREYEALARSNPQALLQAARLRTFAERLNFTPDT